MELNKDVYEKLKALSELGNAFMRKSDFDGALLKFNKALNLIPKPLEEWDASIWVLTAIGDVYFFKHKYKKALNHFIFSLKCEGGVNNPFIQLRLGQCFFELGDFRKAQECLLKAYLLSGNEIFNGEDKKYKELIDELWQD